MISCREMMSTMGKRMRSCKVIVSQSGTPRGMSKRCGSGDGMEKLGGPERQVLGRVAKPGEIWSEILRLGGT